jgi:hypothetical protein
VEHHSDNRATCSVVLYAVDPLSLPPFLPASLLGSITAKVANGFLGGPCMLKEILELALLPTVEVEVLPDGMSAILLGVLLPEVAALGMVENRFIGDDIYGNTEGSIMIKKKLERMKLLSKRKREREKC